MWLKYNDSLSVLERDLVNGNARRIFNQKKLIICSSYVIAPPQIKLKIFAYPA